MTVSSITSSTTPTTSTAPQNQLQGTQNEFLKMFMAQLQNQDPMNPAQGTDMVAQLATFSQVEQSTQTNTDLAALTAQETSSASANMANLVGRNAQATAGNFQITSSGGTPPPLNISSTTATSGATAQITDASGNVLQTIAIPDGTSSSIQWNGKGSNGVPVPPGTYTVNIVPGKSNAAITAQWSGTISAVQMTSTGAELQMGDILIAPGDIRTIGATQAALTTSTATIQATNQATNAAIAAAITQGASS